MVARRSIRPAPSVSFAVHWRQTTEGYRVWRTDWPSDNFEIIGWDRLAAVMKTCELLSIPIEEQIGD